MRMARLSVFLAAALALGACADAQNNPKQTGGALLGGVGGAVAGAQFGSGRGQLAAVAAGTLIGALIGSEVGKSLDRADRQALASTTQNTLETVPTGEAVAWRNPDSGNYGTVTPVRTYQTAQGYCREFQQSVTIGNRTEQAYGTACRQPDGSWKIVQ